MNNDRGTAFQVALLMGIIGTVGFFLLAAAAAAGGI